MKTDWNFREQKFCFRKSKVKSSRTIPLPSYLQLRLAGDQDRIRDEEVQFFLAYDFRPDPIHQLLQGPSSLWPSKFPSSTVSISMSLFSNFARLFFMEAVKERQSIVPSKTIPGITQNNFFITSTLQELVRCTFCQKCRRNEK